VPPWQSGVGQAGGGAVPTRGKVRVQPPAASHAAHGFADGGLVVVARRSLAPKVKNAQCGAGAAGATSPGAGRAEHQQQCQAERHWYG
jgi:hypothetical protein